MVRDNGTQNTLLSLFPTPEAIISSFSPSENSSLVEFENEEDISDDLDIEYGEDKPLVEETLSVAPKPQINFLIVGGAFAIEENAHTLANELRNEGYDPTLHFQSHNKLHLVALGEFTKEGEARRAMAKARKAGRTASWLKKLR